MQLTDLAEKYKNNLRQWIEPLFLEKQPPLTTERVCIYLSANQLTITHIDTRANHITLLNTDTLPYDGYETIPLPCPLTPCYWLLSPDHYQLFLIESLPVATNELAAALNFRLRSMISYPIEETSIDYFKLPSKSATQDHMIAAVVAKRSLLHHTITTLKDSGYLLTAIDIPEMAMRNLTSLHEDDEKSTAFIFLYEKYAILNITRQKTLYFTRRIMLPTHLDTTPSDYEQLALELLRYFDYYQSQWRHPSPTRIFVAATTRQATSIATQLSEYLSLPVTPYHLKSIEDSSKSGHAMKGEALLTLGCALREDENHAAPGN